jgi:membrane associated rhomboid family serine protease
VIWDAFSGHPEPAEAAVFGIIGGLPIGAVIAAAIPNRRG